MRNSQNKQYLFNKTKTVKQRFSLLKFKLFCLNNVFQEFFSKLIALTICELEINFTFNKGL